MLLSLHTKQSIAEEEGVQTNKPDMSFIEFLGEGTKVDREYIDPLQVKEYEEMVSDVSQQSTQQDD